MEQSFQYRGRQLQDTGAAAKLQVVEQRAYKWDAHAFQLAAFPDASQQCTQDLMALSRLLEACAHMVYRIDFRSNQSVIYSALRNIMIAR